MTPVTASSHHPSAGEAAVSKTCLVRFDNNKYSVTSRAVDRPVEIQAYADRIVIRQDGAIVGEHPRCFGRGETPISRSCRRGRRPQPGDQHQKRPRHGAARAGAA